MRGATSVTLVCPLPQNRTVSTPKNAVSHRRFNSSPKAQQRRKPNSVEIVKLQFENKNLTSIETDNSTYENIIQKSKTKRKINTKYPRFKATTRDHTTPRGNITWGTTYAILTLPYASLIQILLSF